MSSQIRITVYRIATLLVVEDATETQHSRVDLTIQRDTLSQEWRLRFHKEFGDPDQLDVV